MMSKAAASAVVNKESVLILISPVQVLTVGKAESIAEDGPHAEYLKNLPKLT